MLLSTADSQLTLCTACMGTQAFCRQKIFCSSNKAGRNNCYVSTYHPKHSATFRCWWRNLFPAAGRNQLCSGQQEITWQTIPCSRHTNVDEKLLLSQKTAYGLEPGRELVGVLIEAAGLQVNTLGYIESIRQIVTGWISCLTRNRFRHRHFFAFARGRPRNHVKLLRVCFVLGLAEPLDGARVCVSFVVLVSRRGPLRLVAMAPTKRSAVFV